MSRTCPAMQEKKNLSCLAWQSQQRHQVDVAFPERFEAIPTALSDSFELMRLEYIWW